MTNTSDEDKELFRKAVQNVRPLPSSDKINFKRNQKTENSAYRQHRAQQEPPTHRSAISLPLVTASQLLSYAQDGLNIKQFERLKQGKIAIDAKLDLHAYTIDTALIALDQFFTQAKQRSQRCLNIIHGKGQQEQAYLKSAVLGFLNAQSNILAYHSAPPHLGGTGAVLVLLKS